MCKKTDIVFVTVANKENRHLSRLINSAKINNIELQVLGMGQPYKGNGKKIILLQQFLNTLHPNQLFMYVDAHDTIFLASKGEIKEKYEQFYANKFIFGGEQNFGMYSFDDIYYFLKYPIKNRRYRYLNAGQMMGLVKDALEVFDALNIKNEFIKSDQMRLIRYFTSHSDKIAIDCDHHLFAVNGGRAGLEDKDYEVLNNRLYSVNTDSWPVLFHVPGKFFIGLDKISKQLNYMSDLPMYSKKELKHYFIAKREHKICDYIGLENYVFRLIKNWSINILIISGLYLFINFIIKLI